MGSQMVVFQLGGEYYGVPISAVREIIVPPVIRSVPQAQAHVRGIINLRGKVISVINLTSLLGLPACAISTEEQHRIIVLEQEDTLLGIEVDIVYEVTSLAERELEPPPAYAGEAGYLAGIANQREKLLLVLDVDKIFAYS